MAGITGAENIGSWVGEARRTRKGQAVGMPNCGNYEGGVEVKERIETVSNPVVGQYYMVPCIFSSRCAMAGRSHYYWPVIGPWHVDAELDFPHWHYHFDFRFFTDKEMAIYNAPERNFARVQLAETIGHDDNGKKIYSAEAMMVTRRRIKMLRQMPEFPVRIDPLGPRKMKFVRKAEAQCRHLRMKCMICPHRGMPLTGQPIKDGAIVCNGHGVKWNVETGEMIPR